MNKKTTIRDVAKATGLSITTISQILNGIGRFSDATIERVWNAVNEMNYTPNEYARKIFAQETPERTKTGLLMRIAYVPFDHEQLFPIEGNHIEANSSLSFELACQRNNYSGTNYYYRHPYGFRNRLLLNDLVDGVVLNTSDAAIIENIKKRIPAVLADIEIEPEEIGLPVIKSDLCSAYAEALTITRNAGITGNVAYFNGYPERDSNIHNLNKYDSETSSLKEAMNRCGIEINTKYFFNDQVSPETNDIVLEQIAARINDLFHKNNVRTVILRHYDTKNLFNLLSARNLRIPEDIAVIVVKYFPTEQKRGILQLIQDQKMLLEKAVDVLIKQIEKPDTPPKKYLVPYGRITDTFQFEPDNIESSSKDLQR